VRAVLPPDRPSCRAGGVGAREEAMTTESRPTFASSFGRPLSSKFSLRRANVGRTTLLPTDLASERARQRPTSAIQCVVLQRSQSLRFYCSYRDVKVVRVLYCRRSWRRVSCRPCVEWCSSRRLSCTFPAAGQSNPILLLLPLLPHRVKTRF